MKQLTIKALATTCGLGYIPFAPGTFGSLGGILIAFLFVDRNLHLLEFVPPRMPSTGLLLIWIAGAFASYLIIYLAEKKLFNHDDKRIVIDETIAQLMPFLVFPVNFWSAVLGFCLFRIFDIWKPFPINKLDQWGTSAGTLLDDIVAGLFATIFLTLIYYIYRIFL